MKKFRHLIEFVLLYLLFAALRLLPLDAASWLGSELVRAIGPLMGAQVIAKRNLDMAYPDYTAAQKRKIIAGMWDNLGRVAAELSHLKNKKLLDRMKIDGLENLPKDGKPMIFFSGHLGNWELTYPIARRADIPITLVYRQSNNPLVDKMITELRSTQADMFLPKGAQGSIRLIRAIKDGLSLALMIDQRMNEGIAVPFFGRPAMTAPAIADLALRYDMPVIPIRIIRTGGCHFRAEILSPLIYEKTGDRDKDVLAIMTQINALMEKWIREYPEQWFWVHKRWPDATKI
jgi:KDO2-lipid IV(A) lauroyltransferase